jgi:tRNA nucleotidyltransferase (CCA-adding enzyme)
MKRGRIFEVGGAVRDRLLNLPIKERDYLVAGIPFQELSALLEDFGKVDLVGRSFGVIKFTQTHGGDRFTFDIALPRLEFSTGVGHKDFEVSFDPYIRVEEDLVRRDFTINAMAMPLDGGELIDPLGGREDLGNKIIRMTSPTSFEEDPLRMLRAVRFAARFQFEIEPKTLQSIKDHAPLIDSVSVERIAEELNKTLLQPEKPSRGVRLMQSTGLLKQILPELEATVGVEQPGGYHAYDVFEHTARAIDESPPSLRIRLAAMFHDIAKPQAKQLTEDGATFYGHETTGARRAAKIMRRLRYSNELAQEVTTLVERHMFTVPSTDKGLRRLIRRVTPELIYDLLELRRADIIAQGRGGTTDDVDEFEKRIRDEIAKKPPFGVKDLALNGRDIMELFNIPESPLVGEVLDFLLEKALDDPQDNRREKLTEFARSYLGNKKISKDKDKVIGET